jgi:dUTP pyrophosphatase
MAPIRVVPELELGNKKMTEYNTNTTTFDNPNNYTSTSSVFVKDTDVYIKTGRHGYPSRGTQAAAGFDLRADVFEPIKIKPNETVMISTGIQLALPENVCALVLPRSGLAAKHGITVANTPGLIDPDYRGEIKVLLRNEGTNTFVVEDGDRIAQLLFTPFFAPSFVTVEELSQTLRNDGGFGSTNVK